MEDRSPGELDDENQHMTRVVVSPQDLKCRHVCFAGQDGKDIFSARG